MKPRPLLALLLLAARLGAAETPAPPQPECVVLLHGLLMTGLSMARLEHDLGGAGYRVVNITYPSRRLTIDEIARDYLPARLADAGVAAAPRLHFVTHSMGSLVVRAYLRAARPANLGRVVMLGPPNHGSTAADRLANFEFLRWAIGVNLPELGTSPDAAAQRLPPADYELGVIAGDTAVNPLFFELVEKPNDGPVTIDSARLDGMRDFLVVPHSHTMMLWHEAVIAQVRAFLREGRFRHAEPVPATPRP